MGLQCNFSSLFSSFLMVLHCFQYEQSTMFSLVVLAQRSILRIFGLKLQLGIVWIKEQKFWKMLLSPKFRTWQSDTWYNNCPTPHAQVPVTPTSLNRRDQELHLI